MDEPNTAIPSRSGASAAIRLLGTIHFFYLGLVPLIGVYSIVFLGGRPGLVWAAGWIPVMIYCLIHVKGYRLSTNWPKALAAILVVPIQIVVLTAMLGHSVWFFFLESAAIEVTALYLALAIGMFVHRPSGLGGAIAITVLGVPGLVGLCTAVVALYPADDRVWLIALGVTFCCALALQTKGVMDAAKSFNKTGRVQHLEKVHGEDQTYTSATIKSTPGFAPQQHLSKRLVPVAVGLGVAAWIGLAVVAGVMR